MATLTDPTYFRGGAAQTTFMRLGIEYTNKLKSVVRYTLTLGQEETASHLHIDFNTGAEILFGDYAAVSYYSAGKLPLYFIIGTDPEEYASAGVATVASANGTVTMARASGSVSGEDLRFNASLDGDVLLLPGGTYYLWLFPGYEDTPWGYWHWYDSGGTDWEYMITLSGGAGLANIGGGSEYEPYQICIGNGESFDLYMAYRGNGESFDLIT